MRYDKINLLSRKKHIQLGSMFQNISQFSIDKFLIVILTVEIITCLTLGAIQQWKKKNLIAEKDLLRNEKVSLEQNISNLNQIQENNKMALVKKSIINNFLINKNKWSQHFKELTLLKPDNVWLTSFSIIKNDNDLDIEIRGESPSQINMADFYYRLSESINYNKILIKYSEFMQEFTPPLYRFLLSTKEAPLNEVKATNNDGKDKENEAGKFDMKSINLKSLGVNLPQLPDASNLIKK
ncbi:MAG: PilN domain-containing protein [Oligoflexia bacterium]|nr:PilN domain-containing protein [Oligoflexia bacterium]